MDSITVTNANQSIKDNEFIINAVRNGKIEGIIKELNIDWKNRTINEHASSYQYFSDNGYIETNTDTLTEKGILFFSRICIEFENQCAGITLEGRYEVIECIYNGKNSASFIVEHNILGTRLVVKFIRPGAASNIKESLRVISKNGQIPNLIHPIDFFQTQLNDIFEKEVLIDCIIYPYVEGITLGDFLKKQKRPLNAHTIATFVKQVGEVLARLEHLGAYHGDLHEENIIVKFSKEESLSFIIIDVSYGITGSVNSEVCKDNDLSYFRQHVLNLLRAQQEFLSKMSIRKYLGANMSFVIKQLMSKEASSFRDIVILLDRNPAYEKYKHKKKKFIEDKFSSPGDFKLQRYEEIIDPEIALKLFYPFPELMDSLSQFGNIVISGNRGSGKSTYLAALAFFPKVEEPLRDFRDIYGIYFPCRQGEFRLMSPDVVNYDLIGARRVKHLIVIKIVRKTLESLAEGLELGKIKDPINYTKIKTFLSNFLADGEIITIDKEMISEIRNLVSIMIRIEMKELDNLFDTTKGALSRKLTSEVDLVIFFSIIRETFLELSSTKFHLLFDDAGSPNIPRETQLILNDFIVSSNPVFCVKLSIERYSYTFHTTMKKQLESGHDYHEYDISKIFYTGSKIFGLNLSKLQGYNFNIVKKRLEYFGYNSSNIVDYLGDRGDIYEKIVRSLSRKDRNAYYHSWPVVWQLADRTPRNLLEIISEIFSVANIDKSSPPRIIEPRSQDRAIRSVSEKRLKSISQISGGITVHNELYSLGKQLFRITSSIGSAFRIYLMSEPDKKRRKEQYLAIERNDSSPLSKEVESLLQEMIKYGILDESLLEVARDDRVKKPIYILNKIYCPAFSIGYRKDQNLRLSKNNFEEVFINPKKFIEAGTKRLREQDSTDELEKINHIFGVYRNDN